MNPFFYYDPLHMNPYYFLFMAPALLLSFWAQWRVQWAYSSANQVRASMSGAAAARRVLDSAGLTNVDIEMTPGHLSDHYDPSAKVLRLSPEVFQGYTAAAVGIAAHEAGHALQDAEHYSPLVIRNMAVQAAGIGSNLGVFLIMMGFFFSGTLMLVGIGLYSLVVFFQLINLPVEFDASNRAKHQLEMLGIANQEQMASVRSVLNAAAMTYVAATLSSLLTLLYYILQFSRRDDR